MMKAKTNDNKVGRKRQQGTEATQECPKLYREPKESEEENHAKVRVEEMS